MNALLSFIYGLLVKIVDDIYDNNLITDFKYLFVIIFLLLTTYIIFLTKELGMCLAAGLIANGFMGMFHFYRIDIFPWKMSVLLGLIGFIYHFYYISIFTFWCTFELVSNKRINNNITF